MCPIRTRRKSAWHVSDSDTEYWKEVSAMCSGGGGYTPPKVDPVPTTVSSSDVPEVNTKQQRRKRGRGDTVLSTDRNSLLSNLGNTSDSGVRKTLG